MRRRFSTYNGLGNPSKHLLSNNGSIDCPEFIEEVIPLYFKKYGGFDFQMEFNSVTVGIEPSYQYERLLIICIHQDKDKSFIREGISFGYYGSRIVSSTKYYKDYKRPCKFKNFIDKWHPILWSK